VDFVDEQINKQNREKVGAKKFCLGVVSLIFAIWPKHGVGDPDWVYGFFPGFFPKHFRQCNHGSSETLSLETHSITHPGGPKPFLRDSHFLKTGVSARLKSRNQSLLLKVGNKWNLFGALIIEIGLVEDIKL
jgi:hypothetical protein